MPENWVLGEDLNEEGGECSPPVLLKYLSPEVRTDPIVLETVRLLEKQVWELRKAKMMQTSIPLAQSLSKGDS